MTLFVILKWKFENFWNLYHIWCFSLVWYRFVLPRAGTNFLSVPYANFSSYMVQISSTLSRNKLSFVPYANFFSVWYRFVLPRAWTSFHMYHIRNFLLIWYIFLLLWAGQALYLYHIWNFSRIWYRFLLVLIWE